MNVENSQEDLLTYLSYYYVTGSAPLIDVTINKTELLGYICKHPRLAVDCLISRKYFNKDEKLQLLASAITNKKEFKRYLLKIHYRGYTIAEMEFMIETIINENTSLINNLIKIFRSEDLDFEFNKYNLKPETREKLMSYIVMHKLT